MRALRPNGRVPTARFFWPIVFQLDLSKTFSAQRMALQDLALSTVTGLGYELVELERSAGGLLRVTIDLPWTPGSEALVTVEDCEKVTRQLQYVLEVEGIEYKRLEISSPGIDRPLRSEGDFERFVGELVDITLKAPLGAVAAGSPVAANRKKFRGTLERAEAGGWQITWSEEPARKPGQKVSKKKEPAPLQVLGFQLDELREARLAPVVDFKGRAPKSVAGES
jgi:ribosome maturation factor RimP